MLLVGDFDRKPTAAEVLGFAAGHGELLHDGEINVLVWFL